MDPVSNKLLLAGRGGFLADALTSRFRKEGWEVFRLGESAESGCASSKDSGVHFCAYRATEAESADLFRTHDIHCVLYLPGKELREENFADLQAVLRLSHEFHAQNFFLLSSAEVYPPGGEPKREEDAPSPASAMGKQCFMAEECVRDWQRVYGLPAAILRCADIYGPGQGPEDSWMGHFLFHICSGQLPIGISGEAKRDFLYVEDAVFAIYQAVTRGYEGEVLHISSDEPIAWKDFQALCQQCVQDMPTEQATKAQEFSQGLLDHGKCSRELGWQARMRLEEGFPIAYHGMQEYLAGQEQKKKEAKNKAAQAGRKAALRPFLVNLAGFLLMLFVAWLQKDLVVNPVVYFDMNFLYIGTMGLLYGKRQALLACALSVALFVWTLTGRGMDAVGILYVPQHLLHVTSYLFTAILLGYFSERRENEKESARWREKQQEERYAFLRKMYLENIGIKDRLYQQIINMKDSIGRLYLIIRRLDSVEVENVFTQAAVVVSEIMNVPDVAIYVMSRDRHFMRQRVRLGMSTQDLPRSQRVEDHAYIQTVVEGRNIYVNRELDKSAPDLAAPIVYHDEVIAVIEIFGMDFDQWSLGQQNLLSVTARIISSSIARGYQYEEEMQEKKYYGKTRILVEEEFCRILDAIQLRGNLQKNLQMVLLRVNRPEGTTYEELDEKLSHVVRLEDFMGFLGDEIYVLLFDVTDDIIDLVLKRMKNAGLDVEVSEAVTMS